MRTSETIANIAAALAKFQEKCPAPSKSSVNPHFRSKYSPLEEIIKTIRPHMAENGLSQIQSTTTEGENIGVKTLLLHTSGEFIEMDTLWLPMGKVNAQGAGSAATYARRYSLCAALGIAADEDDDGNVATEHNHTPQATDDKPSDKQTKMIFAKIATLGKVPGKTVENIKSALCKKLEIASIDVMNKSQASKAIELLSEWEKLAADKTA